MNTDNKTTGILEEIKINVKLKLSALWAAMMSLYIYADFLSLYRPGELEEIMKGLMGPFPVTQGALLSASILVILPAVMVFLSLVMKPAVNRWVNIILGGLYTLVNIINLIGEFWAYYILFGLVEIVITSLIVRYAWKWPKQEDSPNHR